MLLTRKSSYLAASWIWEEYKFILIVLIKRKYPLFASLSLSRSFGDVCRDSKGEPERHIHTHKVFECTEQRIQWMSTQRESMWNMKNGFGRITN